MLATMMVVISSVVLLVLTAILAAYIRQTAVRPLADSASIRSRAVLSGSRISRLAAVLGQSFKTRVALLMALSIAAIFLALAAPALHAQGTHVPVCTDACTPNDPNQNAPGVQLPADRAMSFNQTGLGNVFSAATTTGATTIVQGSSSYTYKVPMYSLPGRAGMT